MIEDRVTVDEQVRVGNTGCDSRKCFIMCKAYPIAERSKTMIVPPTLCFGLLVARTWKRDPNSDPISSVCFGNFGTWRCQHCGDKLYISANEPNEQILHAVF
jgi:hypothetical protein